MPPAVLTGAIHVVVYRVTCRRPMPPQEYSPIELAFGWTKEQLRNDPAATRRDMIGEWIRVCDSLPAVKAANMFRHCGWR